VARRLHFGLHGPAALAAVVGAAVIVGLAVAAPMFAPGLIFAPMPPTIAVMPIVAAVNAPQMTAMAASVTDRLTDGLARIERIRVVASRPEAAGTTGAVASLRPAPADFVVSGELQSNGQSWVMQARMTDRATGEVRWTTAVSVGTEDPDLLLQQSRLAGGSHQRAAHFPGARRRDRRQLAGR
jgi:TolB-like protein